MAGLTKATGHVMRAMAGAVMLALACAGAQANTAPEERRVIETCIAHQAQRFGLDPDLLRAIARVESNFNPRAVSPVGAIGLMQINPTWLPALAKFGIHERDLYDPCTSAEVGAWILSDLFVNRGASWVAVGAYNAACTVLRGEDCTRARASYAWKVFHAQMPPALSTAAVGGPTPVRRGPGLVALSSLAAKDASGDVSTRLARKVEPVTDLPAPGPAAGAIATQEDDDQ